MSKHIFCELDELHSNLEWKESARWLKFEEDVEYGGRWSKPHVATLSLHSMFELRKCLSTDPIYLDLNGDDLFSIIDRILINSIQSSVIKQTDFEGLKSVLLSKHVHQHEKEFRKYINTGEKKILPLVKSFAELAKSKQTNQTNSDVVPDINASNIQSSAFNKSTADSLFELNNSDTKINKLDQKNKKILECSGSISSLSNTSRSDFKANQNFMRKIPNGTEACNVLIGEVDFLEYQFSVFARLHKPIIIADFTEVPVPTRFLFILLGPKDNLKKYREIGRSMATLISDEIFLEAAYNAANKFQLLKAFDFYLDQVTVLPPGEWDPNIRLEPPENTPKKEERLENIVQVTHINDSTESSIYRKGEEIKPHDPGPGLEFTGRVCGGLIEDLKRKMPWYISDFKDGLNFQCLSSILFMYFACLSPIITFGGLLGTATDNNMSAIESLLSGAVCGILFSLFSGQPLAILGSTGPVLVFEKILNSFSKQHDIDYMGFRALIGLWMAFFLILIVIFDISAFVKYITRFTEESFAALIAFIFINESILKLFEINKSYRFSNEPSSYFFSYSNSNCQRCLNPDVNDSNAISLLYLNKTQCENFGYKFVQKCEYVPDVFFFSVILYASTFLMAMTFRKFRNSRFFPSFVRAKISDFGVVITIFVNVLIDSYFKFDTPKLSVPLRFETTIPDRGWFINPLERIGDKWWIAIFAILPAFLSTILIFMDQHITAVIVNRKENKLKKSFGYHLDLLVVAITIAINSLLGIPWFVAATVLSINNVLSLKKESESSVPGEKPRFLGVIEQRLTGVVIFVLIGSSVFLAKFLSKIPMPVLYGIFLYMGISSLDGMQFMHRLLLPLMPEKHQPDHIYLRHVRTFKVHAFTLIQIACLILLFLIKMNKTISISFPIMVLALVGIRKLMDYFFTQKELFYLDQLISNNNGTNLTKEQKTRKSKNSKNGQWRLDGVKKTKSINSQNNQKEPINLGKDKCPSGVGAMNRLPPPQIIIIDTDAE